jgi:hypothetical protein
MKSILHKEIQEHPPKQGEDRALFSSNQRKANEL